MWVSAHSSQETEKQVKKEKKSLKYCWADFRRAVFLEIANDTQCGYIYIYIFTRGRGTNEHYLICVVVYNNKWALHMAD